MGPIGDIASVVRNYERGRELRRPKEKPQQWGLGGLKLGLLISETNPHA